MISSGGSGKWVVSIFLSLLLVITLCYPHQVLFMLKFLWDLIVLNVGPFLQELFKNMAKHWPF
ncbi:MAG TPA: hypothetical protein VK859_17305 [bacterium]|nr:hypothetical protein [bacterium]